MIVLKRKDNRSNSILLRITEIYVHMLTTRSHSRVKLDIATHVIATRVIATRVITTRVIATRVVGENSHRMTMNGDNARWSPTICELISTPHFLI